MRKVYLSLPLLVVLLASAAFGAEAKKYVIGVKGMTWGASCTKAVRETLIKIENVGEVKVDFLAKTALVTMKKGILTKDAVESAFKGSGYSLSSFKAVVPPAPRSYTINVSGMTWGVGCEKRVRAILSSIEGVEKVAIDYDNKIADVTMKPGMILKKEVVDAAMKKSGRYGVTAFKEKTPPKKPTVVTVGISGMTWGSCVASVRAALSKLEGVKDVSVDLGKKTATVRLEDQASLTKEAVSKALGERYKVTSFEKK